jgi:aminoglycoside 6'-N-acetyltransferase I
MRIIDLTEADSGRVEQVAALLTDGFSDTGSESWRSRDEALLSVRESLQEGCISRVAVEDSGWTAGWIAGRSMYEGRVWELHPLIVRRDCRGQAWVGRWSMTSRTKSDSEAVRPSTLAQMTRITAPASAE